MQKVFLDWEENPHCGFMDGLKQNTENFAISANFSGVAMGDIFW